MSEERITLEQVGETTCLLCNQRYERVFRGINGAVCEYCIEYASKALLPRPADWSGLEEVLRGSIQLPTLFPAVRKLTRMLAFPERGLPATRLGTEASLRRHILICGPSGSGKSRLALALRRAAPTAVVDVSQITSAGHVGSSLSIVFDAVLKAADGVVDAARTGIVVLDNLDCWLTPDLPRRNLWRELLKILDGCDLVGGNGRVKARSDGILFVGLLRLPEEPPERGRAQYLLEQGLPEALLGRMPLKLFLLCPDEGELLALFDDSCYPWLREQGVTKSGRQFLAERAARMGLGAWGVQHVLGELDILLGLEARQPKRVDRRYLERRLS